MRGDPIHVSYELSRRQRLVAHLGTWLSDWPGIMLMLAVPAIVVTLAVRKSLWVLAILLLPPLMNNLPPFVAGLLDPCLRGPKRMDIVIEEHRIGYLLGQERQWVPIAEILRVERFGDVWSIQCSDAAIIIPLSAVDEKYIAHVRELSRKSQGRAD